MKLGGALGKLNPLRLFGGYFQRHPWQRRLLFLAPILILLALLNPVIGALDKIFALGGKVLAPAFETGVGRAILLVVLLLLSGLLVYGFAKERILDIFRRYALSLQLRGTEALLMGEREKGARDFRKVVRLGRWLDLQKGPAASYGSLAVDARIKLARIHLAENQPRKARAQLARVPHVQLKKRLAKSFAEVNARVFAAHPEHLPESVLQVLGASHKTWPSHPGIAELYADKLIANGEGERAAEVLADTMRRTSKAQAPRVASRLARLNLELAERALHAGHLKDATKLLERSLRLDETEEALLLKVDLHLAKGELDAALSVLNDLETPAAKDRIASLLRHQASPLDPRNLLRLVPRKDSLLALAEWYLERGELRRAARSLEVCLRQGGKSPRALALLACVKLQEQSPQEASRALRSALTTLENNPRVG